MNVSARNKVRGILAVSSVCDTLSPGTHVIPEVDEGPMTLDKWSTST